MKVAVCAWAECGREFEAKRSTARYCSSTCRQRAARDRRGAAAASDVPPAAEPDGAAEHQLVTAVRRELDEAGVLDTVDGQSALQLARRVVDAGASGIAPLVREMRAVLAEAKAAGPQQAGGASDAGNQEPEQEDEVTHARRLRKEAREAAGLT